jgi:hypothetical protein
MKNKLLLPGILSILFIYGCAPKNTEQTNGVDSVQSKNTYDSTQLNNLPVKDSIKLKSSFIKTDSQSYFVLSNYFADSTIVQPNDVQLINTTCAVLIYPTDEQTKNLEKEYGDKFNSLTESNMNYQETAIEMLDSIDIETVIAEKRFLIFKPNKSTKVTLDIRKDDAPAWNLIFFKKGKEPKIVSMTDFSHETIRKYFGNKNQ